MHASFDNIVCLT